MGTDIMGHPVHERYFVTPALQRQIKEYKKRKILTSLIWFWAVLNSVWMFLMANSARCLASISLCRQ